MSDTQTTRHHHKGQHVTFDEEIIKEHDKLRGTRQKIDEPDTPFRRLSFDSVDSPKDDVDVDSTEAGAKVELVYNGDLDSKVVPKLVPRNRQQSAEEAEHPSMSLDWNSLESRLKVMEENNESPLGETSPRDPEFEARRKNHYNEFEMMKRWKAEHANDKDEEEES